MTDRISQIRITHVISGLSSRHGGPSSALLDLAINQKQLGMNVSVFWTARKRDDYVIHEKLLENSINVVTVKNCYLNYRFHPKILPVLSALVRNSDIIHLHGFFEYVHFVCAMICRKLKKPLVLRPCGLLDRYSLSIRFFKKRLYLISIGNWILKNSYAIHFATDVEHRTCDVGLSTQKIVVEPNGAPTTQVSFKLTKAENQSDHRKNIVFVGRIHPKKGVDELIRALSLLPDNSSILEIIGEGDEPYVTELKALAVKNRVENRVIWRGWLSGGEKFSAMRRALCIALPSFHENFGNVVIEALSVGTPVIVSESVGLSEFVKKLQLGLVCKTNALSIAESIMHIEEYIDREKLKETAKSLVANEFSWKKIAEHWFDHYSKIILSAREQRF